MSDVLHIICSKFLLIFNFFHIRSSLPGLQEAWSQLVPQHLRLKYPTSECPIFVSDSVL